MNWLNLTDEQNEIAEDMRKCGCTFERIAAEFGIVLPKKAGVDPDDEPEIWELEAEALLAITC
jgi:hypothetical protein